jgi:hypothetical protein
MGGDWVSGLREGGLVECSSGGIVGTRGKGARGEGAKWKARTQRGGSWEAAMGKVGKAP